MVQDNLVKVAPDRFTIRDGRLCLNYDVDSQAKWLMDTAGFIQSADGKFPVLFKQ